MAENWKTLAKEALLETLWPIRCAACDAPGELLCPECRLSLEYIDACKACPVCGSPFGRVQCCDCSATLLGPLGLERPPYDACVSVLNLDAPSGRVVTLYKDAGDRGLARVMAGCLGNCTPPHWLGEACAVSFVPASPSAFRRRGWDHAETLARAYAETVGLPWVRLFSRPEATDQRKLTRVERFANMRHAVRLLPGAVTPSSVILVDDVYTTGSTLFAATEALKDRGTERVFCITFARA
ncbi:MAG: ComF family protein [Eggerthellaceae bacterium]|nr:ComF family protein [Eggerthellaceae bacterium]